MARLEGFEPPAHGLEVRSSIHLSYRRLAIKYMTSFGFRQGEIIQPGRKRLEKNEKGGMMKKSITFSPLLNRPAPANHPAAGFGDIGVRKHSILKDLLRKVFYMGFKF